MTNKVYHASQDNLVEGQIYSTSNYDLFKTDHRNRVIIPEHVDRLFASIQRDNYLHLFPIIVDMNYTILDGQHRREAARLLGVPIYYVVTRQMSILSVPLTTATVKKWDIADYLHYYCAAGVPDYLTIREIAKRYPFLRLPQVVDLCRIGDHKETHALWQTGEYRANAVPFCIRVAEAVLDFSKYEHITFYNHSYFINAIGNLMGNLSYDHERMMRKMAFLSKKLVKCPDTDTYIACLNEIYNFKEPVSKRVELRKMTSGSKGFDRRARNN